MGGGRVSASVGGQQEEVKVGVGLVTQQHSFGLRHGGQLLGGGSWQPCPALSAPSPPGLPSALFPSQRGERQQLGEKLLIHSKSF